MTSEAFVASVVTERDILRQAVRDLYEFMVEFLDPEPAPIESYLCEQKIRDLVGPMCADIFERLDPEKKLAYFAHEHKYGIPG